MASDSSEFNEALRVWDAMRFERAFATGRTRPVLIECAQAIGETERRCRFVTKAVGLPEVTEFSLCHEFLGLRLAKLFGLLVPGAALVRISTEFLAAIQPDLSREGLHIQAGMGVGSEYVRNLLALVSAPSLADDEVQQAARLFAFDMMVQNPDRTRTSPNCGRVAEGLMSFDFENAFSFRFAILKPSPYEVSQFAFTKKHLFYTALKSSPVDWTGALSSFRAVRPADLHRVCSTLPEGWLAVGVEVEAHVTAIMANWNVFESELAVSLTSAGPKC